jgi:hypothetical protein
MTYIVEPGPTASKNCPIVQGISIPPKLAPIKKILVVFPLIGVRCSTKVMVDGKIAAIDNPRQIDPHHMAMIDPENVNITARLTRQQANDPASNLPGETRVDIGTASNLPAVSAPQKAEVR